MRTIHNLHHVNIETSKFEETRAFYEGVLQMTPTTDAETGDAYRDMVDDLTGVPRGTRVHFLMYTQKGEASGKILLVHFFERTGRRLVNRMKPGNLGFSLLTHDTDDINGLYTRLRAVGAEVDASLQQALLVVSALAENSVTKGDNDL